MAPAFYLHYLQFHREKQNELNLFLWTESKSTNLKLVPLRSAFLAGKINLF